MITLPTAQKITQNCLNDLDPDFRARVLCWLKDMSGTPVQVYIYCGYRSRAEQARLYAQGRTTPGKIVTRSRPGQSYHQYGLAIDWVPLTAHSKASGYYIAAWNNTAHYNLGKKLAAKHGLNPLPWERPHLQDARYKRWQDIPGAHLS